MTYRQRPYEQRRVKEAAHSRMASWKRLGIDFSDSQYDAMLESQGGVCACCGEKPSADKRLAVDHDHATGRVRGLLCTRCNFGIGCARDSVGTLRLWVAYLEKSQAEQEAVDKKRLDEFIVRTLREKGPLSTDEVWDALVLAGFAPPAAPGEVPISKPRREGSC